MIDLQYIQTFIVVVETGNFTSAAAMLGYRQSSVTHHVKMLERAIGVALLERSRFSKVSLTEAGQRALVYFERLLELADEARTAIINT